MVQEDDIIDQSYTYEEDGFGGNFTIPLTVMVHSGIMRDF